MLQNYDFGVGELLFWMRLPRWARVLTATPVLAAGIFLFWIAVPLGVIVGLLGLLLLLHAVFAPKRQGPADWPEDYSGP